MTVEAESKYSMLIFSVFPKEQPQVDKSKIIYQTCLMQILFEILTTVRKTNPSKAIAPVKSSCSAFC